MGSSRRLALRRPSRREVVLLHALVIAAVVVVIAEQGDKTQVLAFALSTKYKPWQVFLGIFVATVPMLLAFTLAGRLAGELLPKFWLWVVSSLVFIAFGVMALAGPEPEAGQQRRFDRFGPVLNTAGLFLLAEVADQSGLVAMAVAADPSGPLAALGGTGLAVGRFLAGAGLSSAGASPTSTFIGVWIGAVLGILVADGMGILAGSLLGRSLPEKLLRQISGTVFVVLGLFVLAAALLSKFS